MIYRRKPGRSWRSSPRQRDGGLVSLLCVATLLPGAAARADNPIVQTIYTADPAPLVFNGRVYVYTGHDEDGSMPISGQ